MQLQIEKLEDDGITHPLAKPTCDYGDDACFEDSEWFVEGFFYCTKHKEKLEEMAANE